MLEGRIIQRTGVRFEVGILRPITRVLRYKWVVEQKLHFSVRIGRIWKCTRGFLLYRTHVMCTLWTNPLGSISYAISILNTRPRIAPSLLAMIIATQNPHSAGVAGSTYRAYQVVNVAQMAINIQNTIHGTGSTVYGT